MMRRLAYNRQKLDTMIQQSSSGISLCVASQKYKMLYQVTTFLNPGFISYSKENHCKILSYPGVEGIFPLGFLHL